MNEPKISVQGNRVILAFRDQKDALENCSRLNSLAKTLLAAQRHEEEPIMDGQVLTAQAGRTVQLRFSDAARAKTNFDSLTALFDTAFRRLIMPDQLLLLLSQRTETETGLAFQARMATQKMPSGVG